jgi:hypothetical protein
VDDGSPLFDSPLKNILHSQNFSYSSISLVKFVSAMAATPICVFMAALAAALTLAVGEMMQLMLLLQLRIGRFCHIYNDL